jgi:hypothetical protein
MKVNQFKIGETTFNIVQLMEKEQNGISQLRIRFENSLPLAELQTAIAAYQGEDFFALCDGTPSIKYSNCIYDIACRVNDADGFMHTELHLVGKNGGKIFVEDLVN